MSSRFEKVVTTQRDTYYAALEKRRKKQPKEYKPQTIGFKIPKGNLLGAINDCNRSR